MRKYILLMFALNLFANSNDTRLILEMMKENNKNIIRIIKENNKNVENQIKTMKVDLENQIKATNERIDDMNNRIDDMNNRINDMNNRINDVNKRINDTNNRIDILSNYVLGVFSSLIAVIGFIYWDRRTVISKAKDEVEEKMNNRYKDSINGVINTLKDLAVINPEVEEIVKRHNLKAV